MTTTTADRVALGAAWVNHGFEGVPKLTFQGPGRISGEKYYLFTYKLDGNTRQYDISAADFWCTQPALADHGRIRVADMMPGDVVYPTGSLRRVRLRVIERVTDDGGQSPRRVMSYHRLGEPTTRTAVASAGTRWVLHRKAPR